MFGILLGKIKLYIKKIMTKFVNAWNDWMQNGTMQHGQQPTKANAPQISQAKRPGRRSCNKKQ
jgi:hypothetical protein